MNSSHQWGDQPDTSISKIAYLDTPSLGGLKRVQSVYSINIGIVQCVFVCETRFALFANIQTINLFLEIFKS